MRLAAARSAAGPRGGKEDRRHLYALGLLQARQWHHCPRLPSGIATRIHYQHGYRQSLYEPREVLIRHLDSRMAIEKYAKTNRERSNSTS